MKRLLMLIALCAAMTSQLFCDKPMYGQNEATSAHAQQIAQMKSKVRWVEYNGQAPEGMSYGPVCKVKAKGKTTTGRFTEGNCRVLEEGKIKKYSKNFFVLVLPSRQSGQPQAIKAPDTFKGHGPVVPRGGMPAPAQETSAMQNINEQ